MVITHSYKHIYILYTYNLQKYKIYTYNHYGYDHIITIVIPIVITIAIPLRVSSHPPAAPEVPKKMGEVQPEKCGMNGDWNKKLIETTWDSWGLSI